MMQRKPFTRITLDEDKKDEKSNVYTIRLNTQEEEILKKAGTLLQQTKLSTIIKQLAILNARDVLQDTKTMERMIVTMNNVRRNWETGIPIEMPSDKEILGNVIAK